VGIGQRRRELLVVEVCELEAGLCPRRNLHQRIKIISDWLHPLRLDDGDDFFHDLDPLVLDAGGTIEGWIWVDNHHQPRRRLDDKPVFALLALDERSGGERRQFGEVTCNAAQDDRLDYFGSVRDADAIANPRNQDLLGLALHDEHDAGVW
jgi:hypothetical protein